jgi:Protein of unknown function (DUF3485)
MRKPNFTMHGIARFLILLALGIGITGTAGLVCGRISQRWGPVPDLLAAAQHLKSFPSQFGDWQLLDETPIPDAVVQTLSCAGYVNRQYVHRQSGATVSVAVTVGPSGPISVHTPEICYSSRDFVVAGDRKRTTLMDPQGLPDSFWHVSFRPNGLSADQLRVYYAWSTGGAWTAADSPRIAFAGRPLLYKLQMSTLVATAETDTVQDPCSIFLADLLRSGWSLGG